MSAPCDDLHAFFDGELPPAAAEAFREHIAGCAACQAELRDVMQLDHAVARAAPIVPLARGRSRRIVAIAVAAAVVAAAAATALVLRKRTGGVLLAVAERRPLEGRLSYAGADRYRPYDVARGGPSAVEAISLKTLSTLEEQHDDRGLAAGYVLSGNRDQAAAALARAPRSADIDSDRAVLALLEHRPQESLVLASQALEARPHHAQALWNRALALRDLELPFMAARAFDEVAALGERGWAEEAIVRGSALRAQGISTIAEYWRVRRAAVRMVQGETPLTALDAQKQPGLARLFFYDAVRAAQSREQTLRLLPLAEELDRAYGDGALAPYVRAVADGADFVRRAPLAATYARIVGGAKLDDAEREAYLAALREAKQDDILTGALVKLGPGLVVAPDHLDEFRALTRATRDPWFELLFAEQQAWNRLKRSAYVEAEPDLRAALATCERTKMSYRCAWLAHQLADSYLRLHRITEARRAVEKAWAHARQSGDWNAQLGILAQFQEISTHHDYISREPLMLSRAYLGEQLARNRSGDCSLEEHAHVMLAQHFVNLASPAEARAELDEARGRCPAVKPYLRLLFVRAHVARPGSETDELRRDIQALRESGTLGPGELAVLDHSEGRALIRSDRAAGQALLRRGIAAAATQPGWDTMAQRARSYGYAVLAIDAARAGEHERFIALLAEELGTAPPTRCVLAVAEDDGTALVARGPDGAFVASLTDPRDPTVETARLVPTAMRKALAGCEVVDVLARPPIHGRPDLLPQEMAWRFRSRSRGETAAPTAPPRRLVVAEVAAPAALELPPLAPWKGAREAATLLTGAEATASRVLAEMESATEVEIHAHGLANLEGDDVSYIALAPDGDGAYALTAGQVRKHELRGRPVVILAACEAASAPSYFHQAWTLPTAFVAAGARAVIGSPEPIQDADAGRFFDAVLARIRAGAAPATALRDERIQWSKSVGAPWVRRVLVFE